MKSFIALGLLAISSITAVAADHMVGGYVRKDGTYVAPHMQTAPDSSVYNNYSTRGNVNPYTGQPGTVDPFRAEQRKLETRPYQAPRLEPMQPLQPIQPANPWKY